MSRLDIRGWYIDGKLTAKTVVSNTASGNVGTPELVPLSSSVSLGFNVGGSVVRTTTATTVVDFFVSSQSETADICKVSQGPNGDRVGELGVYTWLKSITAAPAGQPVMVVSNLSYQLDFGVVRSGNGKLDVLIVPVKASAEAKASRDDLQTLLITMNPGKAVQDAARNAVASSGAAGPVRIARRKSSTSQNADPGATSGATGQIWSVPEPSANRFSFVNPEASILRNDTGLPSELPSK